MSPLLDTEIWLEWAKELQAISQIGLAYTNDPYDSSEPAASHATLVAVVRRVFRRL